MYLTDKTVLNFLRRFLTLVRMFQDGIVTLSSVQCGIAVPTVVILCLLALTGNSVHSQSVFGR